MMKKIILLSGLCIFGTLCSSAQELRQNIRGQIIDAQSQQPLPGVTVYIPGSNPVKGTSTDTDGYYILKDIPTGRVDIKMTYIGYKPLSFDQVLIHSGKEFILNAGMEEEINRLEEVVVKAHTDKSKPLNTLASTSARTFTVEESQRYAGARNDVSRMASNYAGVNTANDANNDIVIRGNSPYGLLWVLEGVEIPNPNHFGFMGATGGPVSMLNTNVLAQSDFMTGAWPAEYGNATSGVFDLRMRNGNYEKHEFLAQIGFNGFELGAEGPLKTGNHSSFLVNYRYSTLGLMSKLGIDFGTGSAIPFYQDLAAKVNIPTEKAGKFSLSVLAGDNHILFEDEISDTAHLDNDFYTDEGLIIDNTNRSGALIAKHVIPLSDKLYLHSSLAFTGIQNSEEVDSAANSYRNEIPLGNYRFRQSQHKAATKLQIKLNAQHTVRAGVKLNRMGFSLNDSSYNSSLGSLQPGRNHSGSTFFTEAYASWYYKVSDQLEFKQGLHYQYFSLSGKGILEPRWGMNWHINARQSISLGYGLHSLSQPLFLHFKRVKIAPGVYIEPNRELGFTKSHHFVAAWDYSFSKTLRLKMEVYYQHLFNAAIDREISSFSTLNQSAVQFFGVNYMVNRGRGQNMGLDLTFEKFLDKGFYGLFTASLFDSRYQASDGKWRSTAFDSDFVINLLTGKEFSIFKTKSGKQGWLVIDGKLAFAGGQRYTPIDIEKSIREEETCYQNDQAFSKQFDHYFRADLRVSYRTNKKGVSQEFGFDIQNISNHQNPLYLRFDPASETVKTIYQLGIMPVVQYRIFF